MRKLLVFGMVATIVLLAVVQFGPAIVFGGEPAASNLRIKSP